MGVTDLAARVRAAMGQACSSAVVALFYTARIMRAPPSARSLAGRFRPPGTEHHRLSLNFRVFRVLIWPVAVARAVWPPFDAVLVPLPGLYTPGRDGGRQLLMVLAFLRVAPAELPDGPRPGARVLARPAEAGPLLTRGAFARCRHPMLAAVMAGQLGLFLAIPSLFTTLCLVVGLVTLVRQSELEEADLARRHGERWAAYQATTRKWPWSGRLSSCGRGAHA